MGYNITLSLYLPLTQGFQCSARDTAPKISAEQIWYLVSFTDLKKRKEIGRVTGKQLLSWNKTMESIFRLPNRSLIVGDFGDSDTYTRQMSGSI